MLGADDILNADDLDIDSVNVPEWGGEYHLRVMTGTERDTWELYASQQLKKTGDIKMRAKLACLTLCDASGKRLFDDSAMAKLSEKSGKALDRVYSKALEVNKLTDDDIKDIEKN